jgi:hypothetical protein
MGYPVPESGFDAAEHARNKVLRANQLQDIILQQYKDTYQDFWGVTDPPTGSRYTTEQMQQIVNAIPQAVAIDMLQDSRAFADFVNTAYPGLLDAKYSASAFTYTLHNGNTIVIGALRPEWAAPPAEEQS